MSDSIVVNGRFGRKVDYAIEWLNDLLVEVYRLSHRASAIVDDCDVAVFGYSGEGIMSLLFNDGSPFMSVTKLDKRSKDGTWLEFSAISPLDSPFNYDALAELNQIVIVEGSRPMYEAYCAAQMALGELYESDGVDRRVAVINIAGGVPTDSDLKSIVEISQ